MDYITSWRFFGIVLILKMVYTISVDGESIKYSESLTTDISTDSMAQVPHVTLTRPEKIELMMGGDLEVVFDYSIPCNNLNNLHLIQIESGSPDLFTLKGNATFQVTCEDAELTQQHFNDKNISKPDVLHATTTINAELLAVEGSVRITLNGVLLGIGTLNLKLEETGRNAVADVGERTSHADRFNVNVIRVMRPVDEAFRVIVACFVSLVIMGFGCSLDLEVVKKCLKKPIAPGLGLACQYILMPLIGFTVAKLVPIEDRAISFGIFVCGTCPGGGSSNVYSFLLGGDINLSITMTCISTVASLGLMPLWVYTLGRQFLDEDFHVVIPYVNMLQTLAMITIPLFIGLVFKHKFPKAALKFVKLLKPVTVIMMLIFLVVGIISNLYIFQLIQPIYLVAGSLLPYLGYVAGGLVAFIFRQPWTTIKTVAIETGMQNTKVAYLLMVTSFPAPLGDIAAMAPIASSMATPIPPMLVTVPYLLYNRLMKKYQVVSDESSDRAKRDDSNGGKSSDSDSVTDTEMNAVNDKNEIVVENLSSV